MIELNGLLFFFLVLYAGQSAFNILVERLNLIYSLRHAGKAPSGFEGFIDDSGLARTAEYTREKTRVGIIEQIVSDIVQLVIVLSGFLPLIVRWSDGLGLSLITAGLLFLFVPGAVHSLVRSLSATITPLWWNKNSASTDPR